MTAPRVLAVIPARGGSKGVARKNLRLMAGKPLIAWTIEAALAMGEALTQVIVSTDDVELAGAAENYGARVPFLRPSQLAEDCSPMLPVLQHAVANVEAEQGAKFDWVLLLQPTAPLRQPEDIRAALRLAAITDCDSVISVVQVFAVHPILMKRIENERLVPFAIEEKEGTRRQDYQPAAYMRNGAIYLSRRDVVMEKNSIWGDSVCPYVMPEERSASIDNEIDFRVCEAMLESRSDHGNH
jgi:CMP-N,N'-diacetyllegionaminic acid synthase